MSMRTALSQAVLKATDATLTTDNWQRIMIVCDLVKEDPEDNSRIVIQFLERRLEQKDANVILRAISLTIALAENCGSRLKQEIGSKHFTNLLYDDLIENKLIHITLKVTVANCIEQLAKSFKNDPSLKPMNDIYRKILKNHSDLLKDSKNKKKHISIDNNNINTQNKKSKEDEELEEVMKLSLQEYESSKQNTSSTPPYQQQQQQQQQQPNHNNTVSQLKRVKAMYDLNSKENDELSFHKGDIIVVLEQVYRDWWRGSLHGKIGIFPLNYVTPIDSINNDNNYNKDIENKIFNNKDKIDQLHFNLKNSKDNISLIQDDSINKLYGEITPMRPEITKLIGKYAKDRDELGSLQQILINAEATYNDIMKKATTTAYTTTVGQQQQFTNVPQQQYAQVSQQQYAHGSQYPGNVSYPPNMYQPSQYQSPPPPQQQQQPIPQYQQFQQPQQPQPQQQYQQPPPPSY